MNTELQNAYRPIRGIIMHWIGNVFNVETTDKSATFTLTYSPDVLSILLQDVGTRTELVISHTSIIHEYHDVYRYFLDETAYADKVEKALGRYKAYYQKQSLKYFNIKRNLRKFADMLHLADDKMKNFGYKNTTDFILTMAHLYDKNIITHVSVHEIIHSQENNGFCISIHSADRIHKALGYDKESELKKVLDTFGIHHFIQKPAARLPGIKYLKLEHKYKIELGFYRK